MEDKSAVKSEDTQDTKEQKPSTTEAENSQPNRQNGSSNTPDYFNTVHNPFSLEPNPFEQSFSNSNNNNNNNNNNSSNNNTNNNNNGSSGETPGKSLLPPVAAITSPSLPGTSSGGYNWPNSLRSGPLSPAMLPGPTSGNDYFDSIHRSYPTPNESSLRTGLTPGGSGSMFPAPSPNSQTILSQLQSGGATPSTLEFHRTALNAARRNGLNPPTTQAPTTTEPEQQLTSMENKPTQPAVVDPFTHHDAADAANGLFMLAKGGQAAITNMYSVSAPNNQMPVQPSAPEPSTDTRRLTRQATNSLGNNRETTEGSDTQGEQKSATRGKGKKSTTTRSTGRRKAEDTSSKGSNKKAKTEEGDGSQKGESEEPKKMTEEEKRRNFLERNRIAALKCRQRKKQWLANLQAKVDLFSTENDALTATVTQLREEIVNLKTLLLAHKDCPVSQSQGIPLLINGMGTGFDPNPYNVNNTMPMQPGPGAPPISTQGIRR
ncbi:hypothetical protein VTN31DRAFT_5485 [Thermomyces dupontii]|uniref:uncharacterized protein n=1 Tax=Talaromyces thermophilus TaxID=28565 RepID=UPI003743EC1D